jgi:release factor glutamine methyltransferase
MTAAPAAPPDHWTILEILKWTTGYFREKAVQEPRASAEVLLAHVLGLSRLDLYLRYDQPLSPAELARFRQLVVRRRAGEPVAYLTGHKEFWSLDFLVTSKVLIPRPETEVLVAAALQAAKGIEEIVGAGLTPAPTGKADQLPQKREPEESSPLPASRPQPGPPWGLEIGVGSGAVVVALARELPQWRWAALDLSGAALDLARENARRHAVGERLRLLQADLVSAFRPGGHFALVVANLPYVPRGEWERLPADIKDYEPRGALLGGEDGLSVLRPLAGQVHHYLRPGGWLILEVGAGQAGPVLELLQETGAYDRVEAVPDYQGILRVLQGRRGPG